MRVSLQTIADALGLSRSTVSRALNGNPAIHRETRDKVQRVALELGYAPDPSLALLAKRRWKGEVPPELRRVGYLVDSSFGALLSDPFEAGLAETASRAGLILERIDLSGFDSPETLGAHLTGGQFLGVILTPVLDPRSPLLSQVDFRGLPVVACSQGYAAAGVHLVVANTLGSTELLWRRLHERGYRRIGCALYCRQPPTDEDWKRVMMSRTMIDHLAIAEAAAIPFHLDHPRDVTALASWYRRHRPEAILGFNPETCRSLRSAGVDIPGEVGFACFNTSAEEGFSGVAREPDRIARTAMELLRSEIQNRTTLAAILPKTVLLEPAWIEGTTLGKGTAR